MGRRFPVINQLNYVNIHIFGAPRCGVTRLIQSFVSSYNERDVLIHKELNSNTMAYQVPFQLDSYSFCLRICDLSQNTIAPSPNSDIMQLQYRADIAVYCYSFDDPASLPFITRLLSEKGNDGELKSILVGNKVDLRSEWKLGTHLNVWVFNSVTQNNVKWLAEIFGISWLVECSAETGQSVAEVFEVAVKFCGRKNKRKMIEMS
ncbi:hypothetical protein TNIN_447911 [Trichonephila inaurata madagascariensis]|uniref:Uncharacterized protein n=1 Tax=Trichonephila inaurata madagascariensis TaxID=2747483 RepID=A0A8X6YIN2_9ARAC|nr:hypothetical protein TNIN_447911 [Trichonephila inaurata madagascariensis]